MTDRAQASADSFRLQTVRGITNYLAYNPDEPRVPALVRGVVVQKWSRGNLMGRWIVELTGRINVIAARNGDSIDLGAMKVGDRVVVAGYARISQRGQLVLDPTSMDVVERDAVALEPQAENRSANPIPTHIVTSFLLARLRSIASHSATRLGYRQFEPYYISTPLDDAAAEPLSVSFRGWGSPASLAVSPAPQLLQILLETGEQRVFTVARCFSAAYRDGFSSAEKLVLLARQLNTSIDEASEFAITILRDLLHEGDTSIDSASWTADDWPRVRASGLSPRSVSAPCVEYFALNDADTDRVRDLFRILYPPGVVVAEGDVMPWSSRVRIGAVTVHLERLVSLLSPTRLAAIRYLGDPSFLGSDRDARR